MRSLFVRVHRLSDLLSNSLALLFVGSALMIGVTGCGSDATGTGLRPSTQVYWSLRLNHSAIEMALSTPYNTVQLAATPLNAQGDTLPHTTPVTYTVTDTSDSTITLSPTGVITAHYPTPDGQLTKVIASLRDPVQGITHIDTAFIVVTATADPIVTFSLQPAPGDSAKRAIGDHYQNWPLQFAWPVRATSSSGAQVCGSAGCALNVSYTSSNPLIASIDGRTGEVTMLDTGHVVFTATTFAYGVEWRDSVTFRLAPSLTFLALYERRNTADANNPDTTFTTTVPDTLVLGVGAQIDFIQFQIYKPFQITFTPPAGVDSTPDASFGAYSGAGTVSFACDSVTTPDCYSFDENFNVVSNDLDKARRFSVAGTYLMHNTLFPSKTTVIVVQQ